MMAMKEATQLVTIAEAPSIPGLVFRRFRGESDFPHMVAVIDGSKDEDQIERVQSVEDMARVYAHLDNCDPYQDIVIAEIDGEVIAYNRAFWQEESSGDWIYSQFGFLLPKWRRKGIGRAMLHEAERRLRVIASEHPAGAPRYFQSWAATTEVGSTALLISEGYKGIRHEYEMVRPLDEPIHKHPMPEGLEVREVLEEHILPIWEAQAEAFRDHWGYVPPTEENYKEWREDPIQNPSLWKVAWDGDKIAGMVLNYVNEEENKEYGRKRGWVENISVRRPWRRRGLAKSLIAQSLVMFRDMGFDHGALGVDTQNPNRALKLYEGLGFRPVKHFIIYRKPLE